MQPALDSGTTPPPSASEDLGVYDAAVVGAGFGGLGAAVRFAEAGARTILLEKMTYPGGCAATFRHRGRHWEAGATLSSGFGPGQLFRRWIDRHGLEVEVDPLDPVVDFRAPDLRLRIPAERAAFERLLLERPGVDREGLRRFLALQRRVAAALWPLLDDPDRLPPFGPGGFVRNLRALPTLAPLLGLVGRPLGRVLDRFGLSGDRDLLLLLDAVCQITIQCSAAEAEAPFALATLDYFHRGTGHVRGGIGRLAEGLVKVAGGLGAETFLARGVRGLRRRDGLWEIDTRSGPVRARVVAANLLPEALGRLVEGPLHPRVGSLGRRLEDGWGACMLYLTVTPPPGAGEGARHLELVGDRDRPLVEGNHVFVSVGAAGDRPEFRERRSATVSTHVAMKELLALDEAGRAARVAEIQERMRRTIARRAPEWWAGVEETMTASPRTFERFTGRPEGRVGGIPRRAGLVHYRDAGPLRAAPGLWLVGDTVFPGQSTLAAALGGVKAAERALREVGGVAAASQSPSS